MIKLGHEIIVYRDRQAILNDLDLWAIRHFLLAEVELTEWPDVAAFIRDWEWIGPGVYTGVNFDSFFQGDVIREQQFRALLSATARRIQSFGSAVPLDYLAANINRPAAYYTVAQPVGRWLQQLEELRDLLSAARPAV